ncbi:mammalian cell entry protein [Mycobacterium yunnanensis]|uniref:Mammalian cell entry protein n=1 Tax=Mycobacterium yunnanensis TaxID=368477 RepID=A0A9X2Z0U9_9MYCO|nr:mammalian cell entry protein [Mycobacterium yunnanensis]MCV7420851.1 mammalian cell entry protein [Mycobacterium yunnanensis]
MEDQSADSSDLTADAAAASVPQGKAARSRHRLPRQKAQQVTPAGEVSETTDVSETTVSDTDEVPETAEVSETAPVSEPAGASEPEVAEPADAGDVAPPTRRRRSPWKRGKAAKVTPSAAEPDPETVVGTDPEPAAHIESDAAESDAVTETDSDAAEPEQVVLVPHRPAGRALKLIAVAAGVLFVAACAFAGATVQPYLADRAAVHTKFVIAETAASAITTLWTYTPDDMDKLPERSAKYLGGDFAADYKRYIDAIVEPNKQAQVTNNTQVLGAAVESLTPTEATAIVYTNSVATSPVTKGIPSLRYLSYRLVMKPQDGRWLITQMVAVTKLDLTPRL